MLPATTHLFLSEVGRGHLHELESLDDSDKVKTPLSLVVKKKRWYWIHSTYDPTPSHVSDILTPDSTFSMKDLPVKEASEVTDFESSTTFSVKGEIGGKLAKLFQVKLSGSDVIKFHCPLGKVLMHSVDINAACKALSKQKVDKSNIFVAGCLGSTWKSSKILTVVTESWYIAGDVKLTASIEWNAEADASAGSSATASGNVGQTREFSFTLQAGTVIAYRTMDLEIDPETGQLACIPDAMISKYSCGVCHLQQDTMDGQGEDFPSREILRVRSLPADALHELQKNAVTLLGHPAAIKELRRLICAVEDDVKDLELSVDLWSDEEKQAAKTLLTGAGLTVKENFVIQTPADKKFSLSFHALAMVVSSMSELPDQMLLALSEMQSEKFQSLFDSVRKSVKEWEAGDAKKEAIQNADIAKSLGMAPEAQLRPQVLESLLRVIAALYDVDV